MRILRKYGFTLVIIVIAILWWHIFDLFTPPLLGFEPELKNIDYGSIITNPSLDWIGLLGFVFISVLSVVIVFVHLPPNFRIIYRLILVIVAFMLCRFSTATSSFPKSGRRIQHVMSTTYKDVVYNLALSRYSEFFGESWSSYYVFECDSSGKVCSKIKDIGLLCCDYSGGQLMVSDDKLILDRGFEQIQILPAEY